MLKLQFDLSTGKIEQFEAKCCDHDFGGDCRCCCNECENCLEEGVREEEKASR